MSATSEKASRKSESAEDSRKSELNSFIPFLASLFIRLVGRTVRLEVIGEDRHREVREKKGNVIYAFWHNRILLLIYTHRNQRICVMVSHSRDGENINRTIRRFGLSSVRGSSSRGGSSALRSLSKKLENGYDVGVTPDGPRGPRYQVQMGIIHLALKSGRVIVPVANSMSKKWVLKSWDRFLVPLPFTKAVLMYGDPVEVGKNSNLEDKRLELEEMLTSLTEEADSYWQKGRKGDA